MHGYCATAGTAIAKAQFSGQRVGVCHVQGRCGKACGVYHSTGAYGNARLVHQHQVSVAAQGAKELRRCIGHHPVDGGAVAAGLLEVGGVANWDGETLPVDGRLVGAGSVLGGDEQFVGLGDIKGGLALNNHATCGVGQHIWRRHPPRNCYAQR